MENLFLQVLVHNSDSHDTHKIITQLTLDSIGKKLWKLSFDAQMSAAGLCKAAPILTLVSS